jgi:3-hydroxyacyl-CoA dehydrogenase
MNLIIRKAAVLGAGVMGRQIGAHLAACGVPVVLFDLRADKGDPRGIARKAIDELVRARPAPLLGKGLAPYMEPANYDDDLARLRDCDLVIEAIAERSDWKRSLYERVVPYLDEKAVLASNTSGLSIDLLAQVLPAERRARFCGMHFFNPPRLMRLVELIPARDTAPALLDALESFVTSRLGKGVVRAKDTPNFIANRVGTFAFAAAMYHTRRLGLSFDEVDALTGPLIGRPGSATYRTLDLIGLDTLRHVLGGLPQLLADDPWHEHFGVPAWMDVLVERGALGQKTRCGIYRKDAQGNSVFDLDAQDYRPVAGRVDAALQKILKIAAPGDRLAALRACDHPQAQFLWSVQRDLWHYCAVHLGNISPSAREVDLAMRWGYGWEQGPFESWQAAGWSDVAAAIGDDIRAGKTMADVPLPAWVSDGRSGVHGAGGSYSALDERDSPRSALPVYRKQPYALRLLGEPAADDGVTLFESNSVRLWHRAGDVDIAILSLNGKGATLSPQVVESMQEAVARAERGCKALVIWRPQSDFSFGADLKALWARMDAKDWPGVEGMLKQFQTLTGAIKHAGVPVVAAVAGRALGGGCELVMHCAAVVAAMESQPGLVEAGVGLIPSGGGCKELALRASRRALRALQNEPLPFIQPAFQTVAGAITADNALDAKRLGYLARRDVVVPHSDEVLHVALAHARALAESWQPPLPARDIQVAGRGGIATLEAGLLNLRDGGIISAHDFRVGRALAVAVCGGEIEGGVTVDEQWLLDVERHEFLELLKTEATRQRIVQMLETGKPLRN